MNQFALKFVQTILQVLLFTFTGFLIASLVVEYRIFDKFSRKMIKLARLTNIHPAALAAVLGYVAGPRVAHGVLSELLSERRIREGDVFSAILIASFLCRVYIIIRWFLPVVLPLLGPGLAFTLLSFNLTIDSILLATGFLYAKLRLRPPQLQNISENIENMEDANNPSLKKALEKAIKNFAKFASKYVLLSAAIGALLVLGFFEILNEVLKPYMVSVGLSPKAAVITGVYLLQPSAALILCSNMLIAGEVTPVQALPAILLGSALFMLFHDGLKNILPYYTSVYPKRLAFKLLLIKIVVPAIFYASLAIILCQF
ncbi:MAG: hypothetical protein DRN03_00865 [Thermoplasmata archaeon]|nr:MAG: hypothetical protein DRN03_00865 [Thermoplasmata archaeon]